MKRIPKQLKATIRVGAIALLLISAVACEKYNGPDVFKPMSDQGIDLKLTYPDGKIENITGDFIVGWYHGALLEGNYFKQIRTGASGRTVWIRINVPKGTKKDAVVGKELQLNDVRLNLQNTTGLGQVHPELWIQADDFDVYQNASGRIKIIETDGYDILGEVLNAKIRDIRGRSVTISGHFWKKTAEPYGDYY